MTDIQPFVHARTFNTRWGLGLAFTDLDGPNNDECLRFQVWMPQADKSARVCSVMRAAADSTPEAREAFNQQCRSQLAVMTADMFTAIIYQAGVGEQLDEAYGLTRP